MSTQDFEIPPPGKFAKMVPLFIGTVPPLVILLLLAMTGTPPVHWMEVLPALLILPMVAGGMAWSMHRRRVWLKEKSLRHGPLPWHRVAVAALDLDAACVINLDELRELQPVLKIGGTSLPGYRSGWFWLRNRRRAYVLLTDWRRVLMLPKRDGGLILLSVLRPDALLNALRRANG